MSASRWRPHHTRKCPAIERGREKLTSGNPENRWYAPLGEDRCWYETSKDRMIQQAQRPAQNSRFVSSVDRCHRNLDGTGNGRLFQPSETWEKVGIGELVSPSLNCVRNGACFTASRDSNTPTKARY